MPLSTQADDAMLDPASASSRGYAEQHRFDATSIEVADDVKDFHRDT